MSNYINDHYTSSHPDIFGKAPGWHAIENPESTRVTNVWLAQGVALSPGIIRWCNEVFDLGDGHLIHPRTAYDRLGANSLGHLLRTGTNARNVMQAGKHRFVYILDPAWRWRLRDPVVPYPAKGNTP